MLAGKRKDANNDRKVGQGEEKETDGHDLCRHASISREKEEKPI